MQTFADEITLPNTKPESEWIDGRAVRKVMPAREHGIMQLAVGEALKAWGSPRGQSRRNGAFGSRYPG